jgi:heme/copper-type cytochrome/quinol oxidase subunit 3
MKKSFLSLNAIILLASLAYLSGIARLILEVRFVPEIMNAMPANQPTQGALVMVIFILIFSGWLWALLAASRDKRRGLIGLLLFSLLLAFGWGVPTVVSFCPTPCATVWPLTDIVTWANIIMGAIAALAIVLYMRRAGVPS